MRYANCLLLALAFLANSACASEEIVGVPGVTGNADVIELPVLKVYATKDGEHKFVAYVVKWKGSEVIVSDTLAQSSFKVGDTIHVLVAKMSVGKGDAKIYTLSFSLGRPDDKR